MARPLPLKQLLSRGSDRQWLITNLALFLGLSLITLTVWSVWHDEGYTLMLIEDDPAEIIRRTALDVHPPLYYLLLKGWTVLFGTSLFVVRIFSVLGMALAIGLLFGLLREVFTKQAARFGLLLMAISPFAIRYGQEVRMYGLAAALTAGATWLLIRLTTTKNNHWIRWVLYGLLVTASLYTHYFTGPIFVAHWIYMLGQYWPAKKAKFFSRLARALKALPRGWWGAYVLVGLLFVLPWGPKLLVQLHEVQAGFWIPPVGVSTLPNALVRVLTTAPFTSGWWLSRLFSLAVLIGALKIMESVYVGRKFEGRAVLRLLLNCFWVPALVLFILSIPPFQPTFYIRYFALYSLPLAAGLGVAAYNYAQARTERRASRSWPVYLLVLGMLVGVWRVELTGNSNDVRAERYTMKQVMAHIDRRGGPDDRIVTSGLFQYFDARYHNVTYPQVVLYSPDKMRGYGNTSLVYDRPELIVEDYDELRSASGYVWLLTPASQAKAEPIPPSWHRTDSYTNGYAKAERYKINNGR